MIALVLGLLGGPVTFAAARPTGSPAPGSHDARLAPVRPTAAATPRSTAPALAEDEVDVSVVVQGPLSGRVGTSFRYTATLTNDGSTDASGARFEDIVPVGAVGVTAQCGGISGTRCRVEEADGGGRIVGELTSFPAGARASLELSGRFGDVSTAVNTVRLAPPPATVDRNPESNTSAAATSVQPRPPARADIVTTLTTSTHELDPRQPTLLQVVVANRGPDGAAGVQVSAELEVSDTSISAVTVQAANCTPTGGAICPSVQDRSDLQDPVVHASLLAVEIPGLPARSSVTLELELGVTRTRRPCAVPTGSETSRVSVSARQTGLVEPDQANNSTSTWLRPPGLPRCPEPRLGSQITGTSSGFREGEPVDLAATVTNDGPVDVDGGELMLRHSFDIQNPWQDASLRPARAAAAPMEDSLTVTDITCTSTGGATCPVLAPRTSAMSDTFEVTGVVDELPAGAALHLTYRVTASYAPATCYPSQQMVLAEALLTAPRHLYSPRDFFPGLEVTTERDVPSCPREPSHETDSAVSISSEQEHDGALGPHQYTVTVSNDGGDSTTDLSLWVAQPGSSLDRIDIDGLACTASGGAVCPTFSSRAFDRLPIETSVPSLPGGSKVLITFEATAVLDRSSRCPDPDAVLAPEVEISWGHRTFDWDSSNNTAVAPDVPVRCADVVVTQSATGAAGASSAVGSAAFTVSVTNPAAVAHVVEVTDLLPAGFTLSSATCRRSASAMVVPCAGAVQQPGGRALSMAVPVDARSTAEVSLIGTAPAGTHRNVVTVAAPTSGPASFVDPVVQSDTAATWLRITRSSSTIMVDKSLVGPVAHLHSEELTFTGVVRCGDQPAQRWRATLGAHEVAGRSEPLTFEDGDTCLVSEDAPPATGPGLVLVDPPVIRPARIERLGPRTATTVESASALLEDGPLRISTTSDRTTAAPGEAVTFTLTVVNQSGIAAEGLVLTDLLPAGLAYRSATGDPEVVGQRVRWVADRVGPRQTLSKTLVAEAALAAHQEPGRNVFTVDAPARFSVQPDVTDPGCPDRSACTLVRVASPPSPPSPPSPEAPPTPSNAPALPVAVEPTPEPSAPLTTRPAGTASPATPSAAPPAPRQHGGLASTGGTSVAPAVAAVLLLLAGATVLRRRPQVGPAGQRRRRRR